MIEVFIAIYVSNVKLARLQLMLQMVYLLLVYFKLGVKPLFLLLQYVLEVSTFEECMVLQAFVMICLCFQSLNFFFCT